MKNFINRTIRDVAMFMIGAYSAAQFKYNDEVNLYKWIGMILLFVLFSIQSNHKQK